MQSYGRAVLRKLTDQFVFGQSFTSSLISVGVQQCCEQVMALDFL